MNELVMLLQTSNKLDEVATLLVHIAKDLKASLNADNAELKIIRDEIATLRSDLMSKSVKSKT